jgi:hypothetical protein
MMKKALVFGLVGLLSMLACSSSDTPALPVVQPVVSADVVSVGTITGFGSVIANGTEFNTDGATVMMDGQPGNLSDLRVGMVASIRATVNASTGVATAMEIRFMDDAEGPITSINALRNSFVVLGRTVLLDELTVLDDATVEDLMPGNVVQVSGLWRSQQRIQATHIERKAHAFVAGMTMQVKGEISGLDIGAQRFNIGSQSCDYSMAALDLGGADLADGMYVQVASTLPPVNGDMVLDRIQARDRDRDRDQLCDADCDFEIEGYVTAFVSATEFEVDGQPVTTSPSTTYINGTADTLALDIRLAVDGTLDESGVLSADRIVFRLPSFVEIDADVESIDAANSALTLLGIAVATNDATLFRDQSTVGVWDFGFDDLAIGDRTEVRGYLDDTAVTATRVERELATENVTLKAPVESFVRPSVTLLGVLVTSDQDTVFQNEARQIIDADTFFALLSDAQLVRAEGIYDGSSILASKLFLRVCENNCL